LIFNDSIVSDWNAVVRLQTEDSGFAHFDSIRFVERMADPSVLPMRITNTLAVDGASPDTVLWGCLRSTSNPLPAGQGMVAELFLTGTAPGLMRIDSSGARNNIRTAFVALDGREYQPVFEGVVLDVIPAGLPPEIQLIESAPAFSVLGEQVQLRLEAESPAGIPVTLSLESLVDADDDTREPLTPPQFEVVEPGLFQWNPGTGDAGIWIATFLATDSAGSASAISSQFQVLTTASNLVDLESTETTGAPFTTSMAHGDTDNDGDLELMVTALTVLSNQSFVAFEYIGAGSLLETFAIRDDNYARALIPFYMDDDDNLDALLIHGWDLRVLRGSGDNRFSLTDNPTEVPRWLRDAAVLDFNGDAYLDWVGAAGEVVVVYAGGPDGSFSRTVTLAPEDTALTVYSADFDSDGWDDLAVGTIDGLDIYRNDGEGGLELTESHAQAFGTTDIEATNRGSDFNRDGIFDLCLASPSIGGEFSELTIYLGLGDGTFEQTQVRRVRGQIFASRVGDFNNDGSLDIAYINGARRYLALLMGNGRGEFPDELRYEINHYRPRQLDCADLDRDGDMDVVVAAHELDGTDASSLMFFENRYDPISVYDGSLIIRSTNNAETELRSPGGGVLNAFSSSIASAALYRVDLDDDDRLDRRISVHMLEAGRYDLLVRPDPRLPTAEPFSLSYTVDDQPYRIARGLPMAAAGFLFSIYPDRHSPMSPRQGEFIHSVLPTFTWESAGIDRFELASDIGFTHVLESATVTGGVYTVQMVLPEADSTAYFWRVRPENGEELNRISVFNVVRIPTEVDEDEGAAGLPDSCRLAQNYPNPFNPLTTISYYLPEGAPVKVTIHNVLGQLIKVLVDRFQSSGEHTVDWDATDLYEQPVASGIYFYRLEVGEFSGTRKMVLVR
jgi:hypothetical protein